jgi:hypothetical protein
MNVKNVKTMICANIVSKIKVIIIFINNFNSINKIMTLYIIMIIMLWGAQITGVTDVMNILLKQPDINATVATTLTFVETVITRSIINIISSKKLMEIKNLLKKKIIYFPNSFKSL